jgi:thymidylate synthase (FAD)
LVEFAGRLCYRSWKPGLNPNVTKVRADHAGYLRNILKQGHGSVLEHVSWSFVFHNVSRVFTHELVRHRAGTAISQESMRYVRLEDIGFWVPEWVDDPHVLEQISVFLARAEWLQRFLAIKFGLDDPGTPFSEKKHKTSFMRRFAPDGVATGIMWTANVRELRHVIEARTALGAEEEIRLVFAEVARIMKDEAPALFGDFTEQENGAWVPEWSKV